MTSQIVYVTRVVSRSLGILLRFRPMICSEQLRFDFSAAPEKDLEAIFVEALQFVTKKDVLPDVDARFYPYAGLSSTIRLRQGRVYARVSDILTNSPPEVLHALACILVSKLFRRKIMKEHERIYRSYASEPSILTLAEEARKGRGYKVITSARGEVYDLDEIFDSLNGRYFRGRLPRPLLSWSQVSARRILGHHDHVHAAVILSRALDDPKVPRFVVEYVLYHEMLHVKHGSRREGGRTVYHGPEFKADERRFERFDDAVKYLDQFSLPARRRRGRRASRRDRK